MTQTYNKLYLTDESVFVGAPTGSNILQCAELAIFREIQQEHFDKIVYISPVESIAKLRTKDWKERLGEKIGLQVDMLTGNLQQDLQIMAKADVIVSTVDKWDMMSRKWRQRAVVHKVGLYILDHLQMLDATYEVVASRIRLMQNDKDIKRKIRVIGLSTPLANAKDVANWLGVAFPSNSFNFHPTVRPTPLEIHIQGFDHNNKGVRMLAMQRPAYNAIKKTPRDTQTLVFVSDRKQARLTALDLITFIGSEANLSDRTRFIHSKEDAQFEREIKAHIKTEVTLRSTLEFGVGILHDGMTEDEKAFIIKLYKSHKIRILVAIQSFAWQLDAVESHLVVILDAERYDGQQQRSVEYSIPDMLQMMGRANLPAHSAPAKCVLYCHTPKKDYFIKFLQEPLPIESELNHKLHDALNADVIAGVITSKQAAVDWITWTFMYRRISQNPNYYNLGGRTGQHINDFLSELIETTVEDLVKAKCL